LLSAGEDGTVRLQGHELEGFSLPPPRPQAAEGHPFQHPGKSIGSARRARPARPETQKPPAAGVRDGIAGTASKPAGPGTEVALQKPVFPLQVSPAARATG